MASEYRDSAGYPVKVPADQPSHVRASAQRIAERWIRHLPQCINSQGQFDCVCEHDEKVQGLTRDILRLPDEPRITALMQRVAHLERLVTALERKVYPSAPYPGENT